MAQVGGAHKPLWWADYGSPITTDPIAKPSPLHI